MLCCLARHHTDYTRTTTQALPGGSRSQPVTTGSGGRVIRVDIRVRQKALRRGKGFCTFGPAGLRAGRAAQATPVGPRAGMCPEDVRLDLTEADEFLVVGQSPPRTDP